MDAQRGASDGPFRGSVAFPLTDSHCHLSADAFGADLGPVLQRARDAGVARIVTIASDADDARAALALAREAVGVWGTVGVHPHAVAEAELERDLPRLRELAGQGEAVAIGETGLDFHYDNAPREAQLRWLEAHLHLAADSGLPLVVHSRKADDDTMTLVREARALGVRGVLHCFTGGEALLEAALEAGWYLGYGGIATFRNFSGHELLCRVPEDRLLIETDAPYLAPVPMRGKRNEPAFLPYALERIAEVRGVRADDLARHTSANAARLFGLPPLEEA
ncbi:MAG: TatD family hydrolase [Gemmatimonadota bacterium]